MPANGSRRRPTARARSSTVASWTSSPGCSTPRREPESTSSCGRLRGARARRWPRGLGSTRAPSGRRSPSCTTKAWSIAGNERARAQATTPTSTRPSPRAISSGTSSGGCRTN
ncbi:TrmB family transcriptional regulator [Halanaeroarchaeum sulfurireducens]|uniref:TrmB family transcriptional regulator n=1 Tax=Halanaeroarchaeum sulfurireducens TaxID=1604004 RepID=A0A0F7PD58_9EURY|nr:TrmB family transcriptional regulator [Halanaeroarchaeum sulfurireducens]ALG82489.1 TrmB family transcriptional regulator [Halanaeroarchaeum sulfurireducens]